MSNTKMKGLLKGLRYISQIFDEEKEQEIQIGFPTDVKHVAHIGWDGPSAAVDSAPSWMKEFTAPGQFQSAPLSGTRDSRGENPEIKWVSEDSGSRRSTRSEGEPASIRDLPEVPRSRRHASSENPLGEGSTKSRHSSRRHKGSSEGSKSSRHSGQDSSSGAPESPLKKNLPDIPKKSRRKKSKESVNGGGSIRSSRSKANNGSASTTYQSTFSDPGIGSGPDIGYEYGSKSNKELPSLKPFLEEEGKGREVVH